MPGMSELRDAFNDFRRKAEKQTICAIEFEGDFGMG
jgi:hypothetical protein